MNITRSHANVARSLGVLAAGFAANALLPWVLAQAARRAEARDLEDCHYPASAHHG
jgi:hypothetical protein